MVGDILGISLGNSLGGKLGAKLGAKLVEGVALGIELVEGYWEIVTSAEGSCVGKFVGGGVSSSRLELSVQIVSS